jgi:hypothetical protein
MKTMLVGVKMKDKFNKSTHVMPAVLIVPPQISKKPTFVEEHIIDKRTFLMFVNPKDAYVRVKLLTKTRSPDSIHITHDYRLEENKKYSNISIADIVEPTHTMIADASIDRENYIPYTTTESVQYNKNNKPSTQIIYHVEASAFEWLKSFDAPPLDTLINNVET